MRRVGVRPLWLGHAGDARDLAGLLNLGIAAIVDLAWDEPPATVTRDVVYCRFPLVDGSGNPPWLLRTAVETVARLIRDGVSTFVFCGAGLSRSPAIVAASLALAENCPIGEGWNEVMPRGGDLAPGLWQDLVKLLGSLRPSAVS